MNGQPRTKSTLRRTLGWLQIALTLAVVVFWFFELRPQALGGPASFALVNGKSMEPLYHTGDVVIVHRHASYQVGQVVAYRVPKGDPAAGDQVIHRLIGGNGTTGFIVQGDNRTAPDVWHPKTGDVVGSAWLHIPKAGLVVKLLHTPIALAALAALLAMATILAKAPKNKPEEQPAEAPAPKPVVAAAPPKREPEPEPEAVAVAAPIPVVASGAGERLRAARFGRRFRGFAPDEVERELAHAAATVDGLLAELARHERDARKIEERLAQETVAHAESAGMLASVQHEHERLAARLAEAEGELARRRELESSLLNALIGAERAGADLRRHASVEAEAMLAEARGEARSIVDAARREREDALREVDTIRSALRSALDRVEDAASEAAASLLDTADAESGFRSFPA